MAGSTDTQVSGIGDLGAVVDADGHIMEGLDNVLPYLDNEAVKRALDRTDHPLSDVFSYNHIGPIIGESYGGDRTYSGGTQIDEDLGVKLRELDDFDIDHSVVTPTLFMTSHVMGINNDRHAIPLVKAYNSWALDNVHDLDGRFKLSMPIPAQKPDVAAEEIDRWGDERNVVAVALPAGEPLGDDAYDPIYEAMADHDLVGTVHAGAYGPSSSWPIQYAQCQTFAEGHVTGMPFSLMFSLTSLLFNGVPERFPDLEFVFQEGGIGWFPFLRWRLDDHYLEYTDDVPGLKKLPSKYMDGRIYATTQPIGEPGHPRQVAEMIDLAGPDSVMYSADLPHMDFDPPEELFDRIRAHFDGETVRKIMGETAADVFDL